MLNTSDPLVMHLLTETAIGDSMQFEILSFEETEHLKKELSSLSQRIGASKRKLALETKLREAALSLSKLDGTAESKNHNIENGSNGTAKLNGHSSVSGRGSWGDNRSSSELALSTQKCEELAQELWRLERSANEARRRLLEHTAGVLQMTHKGLKKKSATNNVENPYDAANGQDSYTLDSFDDRSLYKPAEHIDGHGLNQSFTNGESATNDLSFIHDTEKRLEGLNHRLREIVLHSSSSDEIGPVPESLDNGTTNPVDTLHAHVAYLERGLEFVAARPPAVNGGTSDSPSSDHETEEKLENINSKLDEILRNAGSSRSPTMMYPPGTRRNLPDQLGYLEANIDDTHRRFENLTDQKTILTTQIQQQRDLNSKSDAQRDEHIGNLTAEIVHLKKDLENAQKETANTREELSMVIDQLDATRQESMIREQKRTSEESAPALDSAYRQQTEKQLSEKQKEISRLEESLHQLQIEQDSRVKEATEAKENADKEASRLQSEYSNLESDMIRIQTELTMVRAELDGAYGSRAQRAAEAAANPAIQKELEDLHHRNVALTEEISILRAEQLNNSNAGHAELQQRVQVLEKELKDTIDDYEEMTKSSIEFEKERERLEGVIDDLRDRSERLETELSEGRIQALSVNGNSNGGVNSATTSTMILKNEFKRMMRDTKAENMRVLKVSHEFIKFCRFTQSADAL